MNKIKIIDKNIILIIEDDDEEDQSNKPIAMVLKTNDLFINYVISGYLKDKFSTVEEKLIVNYPALKEKEMKFLYKYKKLNKSATLEENKLINGCEIIVLILQKFI